jgi:hypothetical protein
MRKFIVFVAVLAALLLVVPSALSQEPQAAPAAAPTAAASAPTPDKPVVPFKPGVKVFVDTMPDGFDAALKEALAKKKVPVTVVSKKEDADFMIRGTSETQKASTAKKVIMWNWHSNEEASIQVVNVASGEITFAYSANKQSSAHGKRSTAEACAKHIKEKLEEAK